MRWNVRLALSAAWVVAGTGSYLVLPDLAPLLLPLTTLAPLFWYPQKGLVRHLWARSILARVLAVASAYLLINATWSTSPQLALIGVATFFVASVVVHIVARTMPFLDREPLRAMSIGFYAAYAACALLICIEALFQHPLHLRVYAHFPNIAPQISGVVVDAGIVKSLPSYFLNKHMAALVFLLWPAVLVASRLASSPRARMTLLACLAPVIPAILASDHETSKIAVAGGAAVFLLQMWVPRLVKPLIVAGWTIACVAVAPLASVAYHNLQLEKANWLQPSAQHRIVIWGVSSGKIAEAPILGHGMVAARELGLKEKEHPTFASGTPFVLSPGPHAHNVYLQIWFDTGLVGVVLLFTIGLFALSAISRTAADIQPMLYAAFAGNALLAASSFSIWSRWFLASYAFSTVFAILAAQFSAKVRSETETQPLLQEPTSRPATPGKQAAADGQQPVLN